MLAVYYELSRVENNFYEFLKITRYEFLPECLKLSLQSGKLPSSTYSNFFSTVLHFNRIFN